MYTGGICPALWRPLAAPHALSVPPYTFDVTPFVGLFNDGKAHDITVGIASGGRHGAAWYVDATVIATSDSCVAAISSAVIDSKPFSLAKSASTCFTSNLSALSAPVCVSQLASRRVAMYCITSAALTFGGGDAARAPRLKYCRSFG